MSHGNSKEIKCPVCGKEFTPTYDWGYAYDKHLVCSYHCMRSLAKGARKKKHIPVTVGGRRKAAWDMHAAGKSWHDVAYELGYDTWESACDSAYRWRREMLAKEAAEIAAIEAGEATA